MRKGIFIMSKKYILYGSKSNVYRNTRRRRSGNIRIAGLTALLFLCLCSIVVLGFSWKSSLKKGSTFQFPTVSFADDTPAAGSLAEQGTAADPAQPSAIQGGEPQDTDTPWQLTLVNQWNPVPGNYEPELVKVQGGESVDKRIYEPLMQMLEAAREGNLGELPLVVSGYRTADTQQKLYDEKIREFKKEGYSEGEATELAEQWVAVPGYSEHQLGFAVDINGATYDVYLWLQENSYKYGFIFRYPGNKTDITGVAEEVWHYRYVGVEAASEMYERGLCLEEYLGE